MLRKAEHPHLNRKQRRHPESYSRSLMTSLKGGVPWLLHGLLAHGGYIQAAPQYQNPAAPAMPTIVERISSVGSKLKRWAKGLF
jgi:hypothetical protein